MRTDEIIPAERIQKAIYLIRNHKVMLDRDLATLYGIPTKALKQAVRRNPDRFPNDFMFILDQKEFEIWRSQFVTSSEDRKGLRYAPMAFTEQGVGDVVQCIEQPEGHSGQRCYHAHIRPSASTLGEPCRSRSENWMLLNPNMTNNSRWYSRLCVR